MADLTEETDLSGKLLIASPGMGDPRFDGTVIYLCAHTPEGSMGLIVNRPTPEIDLSNLLEQLDIDAKDNARDIRVHFGGPVETGRGFVLHSQDFTIDEATMKVGDDFAMSASIEILHFLARGEGPKAALLMLGYSGWGPGQLEDELINNGWLVADATPELVFDLEPDEKWQAALASLGIDPLMLSAQGGRA